MNDFAMLLKPLIYPNNALFPSSKTIKDCLIFILNLIFTLINGNLILEITAKPIVTF